MVKADSANVRQWVPLTQALSVISALLRVNNINFTFLLCLIRMDYDFLGNIGLCP